MYIYIISVLESEFALNPISTKAIQGEVVELICITPKSLPLARVVWYRLVNGTSGFMLMIFIS